LRHRRHIAVSGSFGCCHTETQSDHDGGWICQHRNQTGLKWTKTSSKPPMGACAALFALIWSKQSPSCSNPQGERTWTESWWRRQVGRHSHLCCGVLKVHGTTPECCGGWWGFIVASWMVVGMHLRLIPTESQTQHHHTSESPRALPCVLQFQALPERVQKHLSICHLLIIKPRSSCDPTSRPIVVSVLAFLRRSHSAVALGCQVLLIRRR
jgi:hypothetical protein